MVKRRHTPEQEVNKLREAAGVASALALRDSAVYADVDVAEIRGQIGIPAFEEKAISVWGLRS